MTTYAERMATRQAQLRGAGYRPISQASPELIDLRRHYAARWSAAGHADMARKYLSGDMDAPLEHELAARAKGDEA